MKKCLLNALILSLAFLLVASQSYANDEELKEGDKVADFNLQNGLTDKNVSFIKDIRGKSKYTAIVFANTSCGACRKEMTTLNTISSKHKDFATYIILVDMNGAEIIKDYNEQLPLNNVTYLLDPDFSIPPAYGFSFTPSLLIIDEKGVILYKKGGYNTKKDEEIIIQKAQELMSQK